QEESTEDLERQSGIAGSQVETDYLDTPVLTHCKRRFFWVLGLAFLAIVSGIVIHSFEDILKSFFLLTLYMPMVVATGGNTGAQAATSVIRAMSLGEFEPGSYLQAIWKEIRIGALIGLLLGACVALANQGILAIWPDATVAVVGTWKFGLVVAISLMVQVTSSTFIGAALPILAKSARLDPAVVASPAITTIVDVTGLLIYFVLARMVLGL
ncbi:MAG: magnesium transporter, partial [Verrucomicrobiota bacterium]